jgi:hypothetical protein
MNLRRLCDLPSGQALAVEALAMWTWLASLIGGPVINGLINAYKAKLAVPSRRRSVAADRMVSFGFEEPCMADFGSANAMT